MLPRTWGSLVRVLGAEDNEVDRNAEVAECFAESYELRSATLQLGLYNEEIQIAVGTPLASGAGAEQDHLGIGSSGGETAACLLDERLVSDSHSLGIVVAACGGRNC